MKTRTRSILRQLVLYTLLFGVSACGANSCSCDGFVAQDFPPEKANKTIPTSGEIRVTSSGLTFLSDNLPAIVSGLLPGGLSFCVPPTNQSGLSVCGGGSTCSDGSLGCDLTMTIDDAAIVPAPPDTLDVSITIGGLDETLPVRVLGADCLLTIYSAADSSQPATIEGQIPINFSIDQSSPFNDTRIEIADPTVDASDVDFDIDPVSFLDFLVCEGIDAVAAIGFVRDLALGVLTDQFVPIIQEQFDAQLCVQCDATCPVGTTCDGDGVCRYPDDSCPQNALGMSGVLEIGSVLADFTEKPDAAIDLTIRAADVAVVDTGLTLGLRSGYDPVESALCVPVDPTVRDFTATPLSPTVTGNATPFGQPFHFGLGYHKKAIESMLWSVWASGGMCLNLGTTSIDLLTTGALGALLPSMKQLAYFKTSEAYIKIVPQKPPVVVLGSNDITPSGTTYTVNDPLMTIDWKDFDIHIYAFAQDRFTRIVTIRMDLLLPVALAADGMGGIIPIIGDLDQAFTNERIIGGEIVAEDPTRILDLLPTLIGFALPSLAGSLSQPISIPEFFGFRIDIGPDDITSVDNNTSIAIFADLIVAGTPLIQRTETAIIGTEIDLTARTASGLVKPVVYVDMLPGGPLTLGSTDRVEYSYRVDRGTWSLFHRTNRLTVDSPMLILPGAHVIEVRARRVGIIDSVDTTPSVANVVIDWEDPSVTIERRAEIVSFETIDLIDPDNLEVRYKVIDGHTPSAWSPWASITQLDLTSIDAPDRFRLDAEVRDRAGNIGTDTQTVTWRRALENEQPLTHSTKTSDTPSAGCSSTGDSGPAGLAWLLFVAAGLLVTRRRRFRIEALGLAALLSVGACKCGDDTTDELVCEPVCATGLDCVNGTCVALPQCGADEDCGDGEQCISGECVNAPTCEDLCECADDEKAVCGDNDECGCVPFCDKGCEDTEYCCYESNSCEVLPDPCADTVCEIGFGPVQQSDATAVLATCEITTGQCACEELPPLPLGWHGHYAAIDRNANVTAIATYNSTYEDLLVGVVDASRNVAWQFVDGVPAMGDVEGSLNGPRGGVADKGDDVGRFTALAIDDAGTLHVFYRDEERFVLKYARGTGAGASYTWEISDLDTDGDVGYWSSAMHQSGRIHVVYTAKSTPDGAGGWLTELRHVSFDASGAPSDPTATRVVIDSAAADHPCGADCADRNDSCIASLGLCAEPTTDCGATACEDGTECYQGTCEIVHSEPKVGYLRAVGTNAQLTRTSNGLLVVYYDYTQRSVAWSRWDGNVWTPSTLVGTGTGPWASGMVDSADNLHLAYMEKLGDVPQLTYLDVTANITEVVQDGIRDTSQWWLINDIGEDVDLRVAADGTITVVYQDATAHVLRIGTRAPGGTWTTSDLAAPNTPYTGAHGFYTTMLKVPDVQFAVELVINNQLDPSEASPGFHE